MLDPRTREESWQDAVPDGEEDEAPDAAWEPAYPDGSVRHECWDGEV